MDKALYVAATGARSTLQAQGTVSHNLANADTVGFRAALANTQSFRVPGEGHGSRVAALHVDQGFDSSTGAQRVTGNPLDVSLHPDRWLAVQSADGGEAYTRAGNLSLTPNGQLLSGTGQPLIDQNRHADVLLADQAPELHHALHDAHARGVPHLVLDGTVIGTDRCLEKTMSVKGKSIDLWYSGKAHHHGGNLQGVMEPDGFPLFLSDVEPGSVNDLPAARDHVLGALYAFAAKGLPTLADLALGQCATVAPAAASRPRVISTPPLRLRFLGASVSLATVPPFLVMALSLPSWTSPSMACSLGSSSSLITSRIWSTRGPTAATPSWARGTAVSMPWSRPTTARARVSLAFSRAAAASAAMSAALAPAA